MLLEVRSLKVSPPSHSVWPGYVDRELAAMRTLDRDGLLACVGVDDGCVEFINVCAFVVVVDAIDGEGGSDVAGDLAAADADGLAQIEVHVQANRRPGLGHDHRI